MARALSSQRETEELAVDGLIDQMDVGHGQAHIRDITHEMKSVTSITKSSSLSSTKGERLRYATRPFLRERPQSDGLTALLSSPRGDLIFISLLGDL